MLTQPRFSDLALAKRSVQVLPPETDLVSCRSGSIWITQDGDQKDIILQPGERFVPQPKRRAILYGLEASVATLRQQVPTAAPHSIVRRSPAARGLILE